MQAAERNKRSNTAECVLLYYLYVDLSDRVSKICEDQTRLCADLDLFGRIRVTPEGLNGTLDGTRLNIRKYMEHMDIIFGKSAIDWKLADYPPHCPRRFTSVSIKEKEEVVALHLDEESRRLMLEAGPGKHLSAEDFHKELLQPADNLVLLDVRNFYETRIGRFEYPAASGDGDAKAEEKQHHQQQQQQQQQSAPARSAAVAVAVDPKTRSFSDFKHYADQHAEEYVGKKVLMYCTGGVRCERASAYLKARINAAAAVAAANSPCSPPSADSSSSSGSSSSSSSSSSRPHSDAADVYQLYGGIHTYQEQYPDGGFFKGKNFVYDPRVAVSAADAAVVGVGLGQGQPTGGPTSAPPGRPEPPSSEQEQRQEQRQGQGREDRRPPTSAGRTGGAGRGLRAWLPPWLGACFAVPDSHTDQLDGQNGGDCTTNYNAGAPTDTKESTVSGAAHVANGKGPTCDSSSSSGGDCVVGSCMLCARPWDLYCSPYDVGNSSQTRCCYCRVLLLVCNDCKLQQKQQQKQQQQQVGQSASGSGVEDDVQEAEKGSPSSASQSRKSKTLTQAPQLKRLLCEMCSVGERGNLYANTDGLGGVGVGVSSKNRFFSDNDDGDNDRASGGDKGVIAPKPSDRSAHTAKKAASDANTNTSASSRPVIMRNKKAEKLARAAARRSPAETAETAESAADTAVVALAVTDH